MGQEAITRWKCDRRLFQTTTVVDARPEGWSQVPDPGQGATPRAEWDLCVVCTSELADYWAMSDPVPGIKTELVRELEALISDDNADRNWTTDERAGVAASIDAVRNWQKPQSVRS